MRKRVEEVLDSSHCPLAQAVGQHAIGWGTPTGSDRGGDGPPAAGARPGRADLAARSQAAEEVLDTLVKLNHDLA